MASVSRFLSSLSAILLIVDHVAVAEICGRLPAECLPWAAIRKSRWTEAVTTSRLKEWSSADLGLSFQVRRGRSCFNLQL